MPGSFTKISAASITDNYPLAGVLIPEWNMGSYISQTQLASLLDVDDTATSLQSMNEFELPQKKLQSAYSREGAKDGYLYFQLNTGDASTNAPVLLSGWKRAGSLRMPSRCTSCSPSRNTGSASSSLAP